MPYPEGSVVRDNGSLYRAIADAPTDTPVSDTEHWVKIGDYSSIGDLVTALALQTDQLTTRVEGVESQPESVSTLVAASPGERADRDKGDDLLRWQGQAARIGRRRRRAPP